MAKVSFVVAVYKVADYIEQCVRSLYAQTLEDIEIVLVDDCSPDDSINIALRTLEEYPSRKSQVKIVRHKKNTGSKEVRRDGIRVAKGEYILNVDGDDWVEPQMAEVMYARAAETGADMVLCGFWWYGKNGRRYRTPVPKDYLVSSDAIKDATLNRIGWPNVWCRLMRREILMREDMLWPVANHPEDLVITMAATYYCTTIASIEEPLYHYRYNPNSISNRTSVNDIVEKFHSFMSNNQVLVEFYDQHRITEKYWRGIITNKMSARNKLLPLTAEAKYRKMWRQTYPELNKVMLFGNRHFKPTYREKIWFVALASGLYPRLKKWLLSKRFRPNLMWRTDV